MKFHMVLPYSPWTIPAWAVSQKLRAARERLDWPGNELLAEAAKVSRLDGCELSGGGDNR